MMSLDEENALLREKLADLQRRFDLLSAEWDRMSQEKSEANRRLASSVHGQAGPGGKKSTPEYRVWTSMRSRCRDKNVSSYAHYGGRGIAVCARWDRFANFFADMGERPSPAHSIDRIDNDGPYSPENCRWATAREQRENQRADGRNSVVKLTIGGVTRTVADWAAISGLNHTTLWWRFRVKKEPETENILRAVDPHRKRGPTTSAETPASGESPPALGGR